MKQLGLATVAFLLVMWGCSAGLPSDVIVDAGWTGPLVPVDRSEQLSQVDRSACDVVGRVDSRFELQRDGSCPHAETDLEKSYLAALRALDTDSFGGFWIHHPGEFITVAYVGAPPDIGQLYKVDTVVRRTMTYEEVMRMLADLNRFEPDSRKYWRWDYQTGTFRRANSPQILPSDG